MYTKKMSKKLTKKAETRNLFDGVEIEGFDYYFLHYTRKWESTPSEIQELVRNYVAATVALENVIDSWELE